MNKEQVLNLASELLESLNRLPSPMDDNYNREYNEGYTDSVLKAVQALHASID